MELALIPKTGKPAIHCRVLTFKEPPKRIHVEDVAYPNRRYRVLLIGDKRFSVTITKY